MEKSAISTAIVIGVAMGLGRIPPGYTEMELPKR